MQTSPVMNPANVLSSPAPGPKQSNGSAPATAFNQVLSREMAERRPTPEVAKSKQPESPSAVKQKSPASAGNTNASAQNNVNTAHGNTATKTPAEGDKSDKNEDTQATTGEDAQVSASADMLALVTNLNPMLTPPERSAQVQPTEGQAFTAHADKAMLGADLLKSRVTDTGKLAASIEPAAVAKPNTDFSNLMTRMAETQQLDMAAPRNNGTQTGESSLVAMTDLLAAEQNPLNSTQNAPPALPGFASEMKDALAGLTAGAMQPVQQTVLQTAAPTYGPASDKLSPPVGSAAWDQALGQKVVWMVAGEQQSASLTLNPPDLGPLQVVLNVSNAQADATFIAAQPEVRQALEAALPKLRDMLSEAGIQLGQASVNSGNPHQQGASDQQRSPASSRFGHADNHTEAPAKVTRIQPTASGLGMVDTFV